MELRSDSINSAAACDPTLSAWSETSPTTGPVYRSRLGRYWIASARLVLSNIEGSAVSMASLPARLVLSLPEDPPSSAPASESGQF